jgi:hypothetical protein
MKWIFSHATDNIHHWQLQKEEGRGSLSFNLQHLSLRLSGTSKRVFFLRLQGLLQKKALLHSEYGAAIGETTFAESPSAGQMIFNEQKIFYHVNDAQLRLFADDKQLLATCELPTETTIGKLEFYALLFGLAWFLTADAQAEKERLLAVTV